MNNFSDLTLDRRPVVKQGSSIPDKAVPGPIFKVSIVTENWNKAGETKKLNCGAMEILSCKLSGPPDVMNISAVSAPVATSLRREEKNRPWQRTTLDKIAGDIARGAGLELVYEVDDEIKLDRVDQIKKPDLVFLYELCLEYGIALKVCNKKIVLFDEAKYEQREAVATYSRVDVRDENNLNGGLLNYDFGQERTDTVCKSEVSYKDPKSGRLVKAEFIPPKPPVTGQVLRVKTRPGDLLGDLWRSGETKVGEEAGGTFETGFTKFNDTLPSFKQIRSDATDNALRKARALARQRNKMEWPCELTVTLNLILVGGVTFNIHGFGVYSGKYFVDQAIHNLGGGSTTTVSGHKVLEGY